MLCRHVFGKISSEFRGISRVFVNFADLLEIRGSATARNIRSPVLIKLFCLAQKGLCIYSVNFIPLASKQQNGGNNETEPTKEWLKRSKRSEITEISKGLYRNSICYFSLFYGIRCRF